MGQKVANTERAQISSQSDKVMYDRFDQDFQRVAQDLNLGEGYMTDDEIKINVAQMS